MVNYGVERLDLITAQMILDMGYSSELVAYLTSENVKLDEVKDAVEAVADKNIKVDALVGNILGSRPKVVGPTSPVEEQKSSGAEVGTE